MNKIRVEIKIALKLKMCRRCINDATQTTRLIRDAHRTNLTWIFQDNKWKEKNYRIKKIEFRQAFQFFIDTLFEFWRLIVWTKNKNYKSKKVFKIFALTKKNAFNVILEMIKNFSFKIEMLHQHFFSNTTKTNFNNLQKFNYRVFVEKSIINI